MRIRCLALLDEHVAARRDQQDSDRLQLPATAADYFLQGESHRCQDIGASTRLLGDESHQRGMYLAQAIEEYQQALRLDPRHYWARFQLGRAQLALGQTAEAIATLSACIAVRPKSPWAYTSRGLAYALAGRAEEALGDLDRAMQLDPNFQPAQLNRGVVHLLLDHASDATNDFDAVLAAPADRRLIEAAYYRGQLYATNERDAEAIADLSAVIEARPDFGPAYWLRAKVRCREGKYDEGQADVSRIVSIGERTVPSQRRPGALLVAQALRRLAHELKGEPRREILRRAASETRAAIVAGPRTAEIYQHLGVVQEKLDDTPAAITSYSAGLALAPDHVALHNLRGWAYLATDNAELARADFAAAVRIEPGNAESHTALGFILSLSDAGDEARYDGRGPVGRFCWRLRG